MLRLLSCQLISSGSGCVSKGPICYVRCLSNLTSSHQIHSSSHRFVHSDKSPPEFQDSKIPLVVYQGRLGTQIRRTKLFSFSTTILGLATQPLLYNQITSLPVLIVTCSIAGFFTFVTPFLLHQLVKRYVNYVSYNAEKDTYYAHCTTFLFQEKKIPFGPGDGKVPDNAGMFTTMEVKGVPMMIELDIFDKEHLIRILGYDKPLNIEHERIEALMKDLEADQQKTVSESSEKASSEEQKQRSSNRS
ncbi:transmembrane protein 70 homolog, mitochondrial [Frankliniella occidentalis]|uniref:Transmembrane protein 70 homolog, mitochondrial n=1 Tax=Frankliniella occidentalis TaxID=133901 RepID=A0A6J1S298_FRAOC|nr:transmembrane protein 70 homolog, mitochondrial [Frankliniella occidentalis]